MDKVLISNSQGESGIVNVIRYFTNNGVEYLIYSLNEVDEGGYTRLYVTKINGVDGVYNADTLNDNEWNEIKNIVKLIVKANKEGLPVPVQDLNPKKINNIILKDKKVFKLNAPLVADLGNNKPTFGEVEEKPVEMQKNIFEVPSTPTFETPVQPIFEQNTSTFEMPAQPTFEQSVPSFEMPVQPNINSNLNAMTDYQRLYNEELTKNENMKEQITKLNAELEKYKNIISNVKNMIEE